MASTVLPSERLFEQSLKQGQVRHAIKVAVACSLATVVVYYFHVRSGQLAPLFAFLLMTLGMPSPRMNWLLTQIGVLISALASSIILVHVHEALFLYLGLTLLWIFVCLLLSGWLPLPATMAGMIAAISVFTFLDGGVGAALNFFVDYNLNFLIGGISVVVIHTLIWPLNSQKVFVRRLAQTYAHLEQECRQAGAGLRTGQSPPADQPIEDWAPFRPLRQMVAPELFRGRDTANPFARLILTCRSLNLRLWFFNRSLGDMPTAALAGEACEQLAGRLDAIASHLAMLVTGALNRTTVPLVEESLLRDVDVEVDVANSDSQRANTLVAHHVPGAILHMLVRDIQTATTLHNGLFATRDHGVRGELVSLWPGPNRAALFDVQSVRAAVKLVMILALLMLEEGWLGLPGGAQVAFFATFFASTANLGRQNKTDLIDVVGLLSGFAYGVVAAFLTSRLPHFPLLLALVFLGQFLADLAYQRLPRYSVAGLQAGLAIPFTYLATVGPEWGSFVTVRTRLAGLLLAGFTAVAVHAVVWPVLPMRQLRASIAAALRASAESIAKLFAAPRTTWIGSPPSLRETIVRARDLLDDARYLPGAEHADLSYNGILASLQEIDACLDYIHLLLCVGAETPIREQFFAVAADYPIAARTTLDALARQFDGQSDPSPSPHWQSNATERWDQSPLSHSLPATDFESSRLVVIARCLDHVAAVVQRIASITDEIDRRNRAKS